MASGTVDSIEKTATDVVGSLNNVLEEVSFSFGTGKKSSFKIKKNASDE